MGLDMYLNVRKYIKKYDWSAEDRTTTPEYENLLESAGLDSYVGISSGASGVIVEATAIYWRKANAIHKWFVDKCGHGVDDCTPIYVSREHLETLRDTLASVQSNASLAFDEFPTKQGDFFGSTEHNEYYWESLETTHRDIKKLLEASTEDSEVSFEYQASW